MKPTLVVLAAGMGSRYGGLKQVDPVGPSGEAILDYSVFDAIRGGFGKVVFIIDCRTSICREVRTGIGGSSARSRLMSGDITVLPFATARIVDIRTASSAVFMRAPAAPDSMAWAMPSDEPNVVRIITFVSGSFS